MVKLVIEKCGCWPQSSGLTKTKNFKSVSSCSFVQHASCVAPITSQFKLGLGKNETNLDVSFLKSQAKGSYIHVKIIKRQTRQKPTMNCNCPRKCLQDELTIGHIQYGKYQGDKFISRAKMLTSVMLYLKPEQKTLQLELGFLRSLNKDLLILAIYTPSRTY